MNLITNKSLAYVLDHVGDPSNIYYSEITRVSFDTAMKIFKNNCDSCEIYYDAPDYKRFTQYLTSNNISYVNSYSKKIDSKSMIVCDICDGKATVLSIDSRNPLY